MSDAPATSKRSIRRFGKIAGDCLRTEVRRRVESYVRNLKKLDDREFKALCESAVVLAASKREETCP